MMFKETIVGLLFIMSPSLAFSQENNYTNFEYLHAERHWKQFSYCLNYMDEVGVFQSEEELFKKGMICGCAANVSTGLVLDDRVSVDYYENGAYVDRISMCIKTYNQALN